MFPAPPDGPSQPGSAQSKIPPPPFSSFIYLPPLGSPRPAQNPEHDEPDEPAACSDPEDLEEPEEWQDQEDLEDPDEWKDALREDFESWLDTLDSIPDELTASSADDSHPDLATLFGDLSSLALEHRKSNRRTAEAFTRWNTVLTEFQGDLTRLRERERALLESQPLPDPMPTPVAAFLVDFHDRLSRVTQAQAAVPSAKLGFFGNDAPWRTAWSNQLSALDITLSHLRTFLKEQGFQRIETLGQPLDPARMAVVEAQPHPDQPPHTVIKETVPGWMLGTRVLRPAQVVVTIAPPQSNI